MHKKNIVQIAKHNIIRLRKTNGLSQTDLAKKMKTSQRLVAYYENKAASIPLGKLQEFAEALDVSIGTLLYERYTNNSAGPEIDLRLMKKLKLIDMLPRRAKDALIHSIISTSVR